MAAAGLALALFGLLFVQSGEFIHHGTVSDEARTRCDLDAISDAIDLYRLDTGSNPLDLKDLTSTGKGDAPYLNRSPEDLWGNPYVYRHYSGRVYELLSYGADGLPGGEGEGEDIVFRVGFDPRD